MWDGHGVADAPRRPGVYSLYTLRWVKLTYWRCNRRELAILSLQQTTTISRRTENPMGKREEDVAGCGMPCGQSDASRGSSRGESAE